MLTFYTVRLMQRHGFDVSGLGPRHYVREDTEVPNPLDDKSESWELIFCCRVICFRVTNGFWRSGQVYFYRKGGRKLLCSVYSAFIAESGCDEGVNISDIDTTKFSFTRPLFISCMCLCPRQVYKTPRKSTTSRPSAFSQKYALIPQYSRKR